MNSTISSSDIASPYSTSKPVADIHRETQANLASSALDMASLTDTVSTERQANEQSHMAQLIHAYTQIQNQMYATQRQTFRTDNFIAGFKSQASRIAPHSTEAKSLQSHIGKLTSMSNELFGQYLNHLIAGIALETQIRDAWAYRN
jgi:hypothetical protein